LRNDLLETSFFEPLLIIASTLPITTDFLGAFDKSVILALQSCAFIGPIYGMWLEIDVLHLKPAPRSECIISLLEHCY
jgi:hypothetical protein